MKRARSTLQTKSTKACVVYDSNTGRMPHLHRVVTFVGGRLLTDAGD
jgi:hypothetical protein